MGAIFIVNKASSAGNNRSKPTCVTCEQAATALTARVSGVEELGSPVEELGSTISSFDTRINNVAFANQTRGNDVTQLEILTTAIESAATAVTARVTELEDRLDRAGISA